MLGSLPQRARARLEDLDRQQLWPGWVARDPPALESHRTRRAVVDNEYAALLDFGRVNPIGNRIGCHLEDRRALQIQVRDHAIGRTVDNRESGDKAGGIHTWFMVSLTATPVTPPTPEIVATIVLLVVSTTRRPGPSALVT